MARVFLTHTAREALAALDLLRADAVLDALGELERDPRLGHELRGRLTGLRSYRVGGYRIVYELRDGRTVRGPPRDHCAASIGASDPAPHPQRPIDSSPPGFPVPAGSPARMSPR